MYVLRLEVHGPKPNTNEKPSAIRASLANVQLLHEVVVMKISCPQVASMSWTRRATRMGNSWRAVRKIKGADDRCSLCRLQKKLAQALGILQVEDLLKGHLAGERAMVGTTIGRAKPPSNCSHFFVRDQVTGWGRSARAKWTTSDSSSSSNRCLETSKGKRGGRIEQRAERRNPGT